MYILGIDTETTGLDSTKDRIIEIGAVIWETELCAPVLFWDVLIDPETPILPETTELTGITQDMINKFSITENEAVRGLEQLTSMGTLEIAAAHNAPFDIGMLTASFHRQGMELPKLTWIDTAVDIPYPRRIETRKLTHLGAEHKFVNPFAHRACTDVLSMLTVLSNYNFDEILANSKIPNITIRANTGYEQRELAKAKGFRWDGASKVWIKRIKENQLDFEKKACEASGFSIGEWKT